MNYPRLFEPVYIYVVGRPTYNDYGDITGCSPEWASYSLNSAKAEAIEELKKRLSGEPGLEFAWRVDPDDEDIHIVRWSILEKRTARDYIENRNGLLIKHDYSEQTVRVDQYDEYVVTKIELLHIAKLVGGEEYT